MRISVVVPTYNRAHLLTHTLDAILSQSFRPAEIIIVNDGSTDDTLERLAPYGAAIRVITVANGGDIAARNVGTRAAGGEIVAYCDSDDLWAPGFLAAQAALWRAQPGLLSAFGNFRRFAGEVWEEATKFDTAPAGFWNDLVPLGDSAGVFETPIVEKLLSFQPFFPSAMTVAREAFLEVGGWDETASRIVGCDFATALRVAEHPLGVTKPALVGIRRHDGNISGDAQKMNLGDARILEMLLETRPSLARHRAAVQRSIVKRRLEAAHLAFDRRDFRAVLDIVGLLPAREVGARLAVKRLIAGVKAFFF